MLLSSQQSWTGPGSACPEIICSLAPPELSVLMCSAERAQGLAPVLMSMSRFSCPRGFVSALISPSAHWLTHSHGSGSHSQMPSVLPSASGFFSASCARFYNFMQLLNSLSEKKARIFPKVGQVPFFSLVLMSWCGAVVLPSAKEQHTALECSWSVPSNCIMVKLGTIICPRVICR